MRVLIEQLINGLTIGSFYGLIALGYSMVYGVLKLIIFTLGPALGAVTGVMVGMYYRQISFTMGWSFGLNPRETEELMDFIRRLVVVEELTVLLIEHDMNVVMGISDRVTVMDGGAKIAEGLPEQIYHDPTVIEACLGRER